MTDDVYVDALSARQIETRALAWRDFFEIANQWVPDVVRLLEHQLSEVFPLFSLVVCPDNAIPDAEGYTQFEPPQIVLRESVYIGALQGNPRSRMTVAHELGHLLLHKGVAKARSTATFDSRKNKPFNSAEWQARKFAAYFLMPEHLVREFGSAEELAAGCRVSLQSARIRLDEVGHIKPKPIPDIVKEFLKHDS